ncbi:MAG TPA: ribosomal protein S18-alanine N-acetyltransferase [Candidatus Cloacimonadota bacterium]|jgi:ribosomal-protein-alanine N-acetyltransferase|nr:ribosomal protein S18-alanine N-acetyltransferase [Candidatus Cloacimonadota bacterium]
MKLDIRPVQESDFPAICEIEGRAFVDPWPKEAFTDFLCRNSWVLFMEQKLIGYIFYHTAADEAVIINFAIDPSYQGEDYGKYLLHKSMQFLINCGVQYFYLDVRKSNFKAIALYHLMGFQTLGFRKNYYHTPPEDAIVMGVQIPIKDEE